MIDRLRKKIIAINVISVCIVFFVAVVLLFSVGYARVAAEREKRIEAALDFDYEHENFVDNKMFADIALVVIDSKTGTPVYCGIGPKADLDLHTINAEMLNNVIFSNHQSGLLSLRVSYTKMTDGNLTKIVFDNRYSKQNSIAPYVIWTAVTLFIGICCYLVISMILAQIALKPVQDSWDKQKQFVADASHELKTPLSVIMANTEIIASHQDETVSSQMKWIENTRAESKRMADLVANLLFIAKNDDGLKVQMEEIDVSRCIEAIVLSYDAVFYENGKSFRYDIEPNLNIVGNSGQIKQLATILLDNANKYSVGDGNIVLNLCSTKRHVTLTVENDSEQLTEEQLSHLFDRFYTVDQSRNVDKGGNGLGLAIAQLICSTHGGEITVASQNGRTSFVATFPLRKADKD